MDEFEKELEEQVTEADARARSGRLKRLRLLHRTTWEQSLPVPVLAHLYYEEARLCWYVGAFVAAIVMAQLAFEELFRSWYRSALGMQGTLKAGKSVEQAGFADLISEARAEGFLSDSEFESLDHLRRCRNPYVHTKDLNPSGIPTFFDQAAKMVVPELVGVGVEEEAQQAIETLIGLFPLLCGRRS